MKRSIFHTSLVKVRFPGKDGNSCFLTIGRRNYTLAFDRFQQDSKPQCTVDIDSGRSIARFLYTLSQFLLMTSGDFSIEDVFDAQKTDEEISFETGLECFFRVCSQAAVPRVSLYLKNAILGDVRVEYYSSGKRWNRVEFPSGGDLKSFALLYFFPELIRVTSPFQVTFSPVLVDGTVLPEVPVALPGFAIELLCELDPREVKRALEKALVNSGKAGVDRLLDKIRRELYVEGDF